MIDLLMIIGLVTWGLVAAPSLVTWVVTCCVVGMVVGLLEGVL